MIRPVPAPNLADQRLQPHAALTDYYAGQDQHRQFVQRIFDSTAVDYDRIERILALGTARGIAGKPWAVRA